MDKFKITGKIKRQQKCIGRVSKNNSSKHKRSYEKMLNNMIKRYDADLKHRLKNVMTPDTASTVDPNIIKKGIKKTKTKSMTSQIFQDSDSVLQHLHKSQQIFDKDSCSDDLELESRSDKSSSNSSDKSELEAEIDKSSSERSSSINSDRSELEEEDYEDETLRFGKKKRKEEVQVDSPLVVELQKPIKYKAPPPLFQKFESDTSDNLDAALKQFYESLMETSAEFCTTPSTSTKVPIAENTESESSNKIVKWNKSKQTAFFHRLGQTNSVLVLMKHPESIFFKGTFNITVLRGCIEVLGCVMDSYTNANQTVCSPKGHCMLCIETCFSDPTSSEDYELLKKVFKERNLDTFITNVMMKQMKYHSCVLLLEAATPSPMECYLKNVTRDLNYFSFSRADLKHIKKKKSTNSRISSEHALNCVFEYSRPEVFKQYTKSGEWEEIASKIIRSNKEDAGACIAVCGGKNLGKSTLFEFLVNRCLGMFSEVLCLDFDPGQSEFTVPGCVSAVLVTQPLLGPNFTHHRTPERMVFVGHVNVGQVPGAYLDSVQYIINYCRSRTDFQKMPWIVNTMGFAKDIGVDLTVSLLRMLNPRYVVQIHSQNVEYNFPAQLTPGYVWQYQSLFHHTSAKFLQYTLLNMRSIQEDVTCSNQIYGYKSMTAAQLRDAMVLAYISQIVEPPGYSLTEVLPYRIPFSKLTLGVCHDFIPPSLILRAMNGRLVALCVYKGNDVLIPQNPSFPRILRNHAVCPCLGFGVVRGIDPQKKNVFLLTCLSEKELSQVNCLMLGAVSLPDCVYTILERGSGCVPYVAIGPGQTLGTIRNEKYESKT